MLETQSVPAVDEAQRDAFADRVFDASLGFVDTMTIYLGDRLGMYAEIAAAGSVTAGALAHKLALDERYVREWLEQQAASGILDCADVSAAPAAREYSLSAEHADVLVDANSLSWMAPFVREMVGTAPMMSRIVDAFRTGDGIPYADYGSDVIEGQADINRAVFLNLLGREWLPQIGDVHARLSAGAAQVADIGCGAGWSATALARAYPGVTVDGFDLDPESVAIAQKNVREAGLDDRVRIHLRDGADETLAGRYDLVIACEMVHDLAQPVAVLQTMRRLVADDGAVIIVDERAGETFAAPADALDRLFYGWSVLLCLPNGRAEQPSVATGTVLRPATLAAYATDAGFSRTEVLPIDHAAFRLYRLWQ